MAVIIINLVMASTLTDTIDKTIQSAPDEKAALELVKKYVAQTDDIEDLRLLQNYWLKLSPEECRLYFAALKDKNPNSPKYIYLWARTIEDPKVQMDEGRKLVKKYPSFEYGYRIFLSNYQKQLFTTPGPEDQTALPMMPEFKKDRKYFDLYLKNFPTNENAIYLSLSLYVWEKDVPAANKMLVKAQDANAPWLNWQFYTDYYVRTNQLLMLQAYLRRLIDTSTTTQNLSAKEKEDQFELSYLTTLVTGEAYTDFLSYIKTHPTALENKQIQQMLLLVYTYQSDNDKAFGLLDEMLTHKDDYYTWLVSDEELATLRSDPRWTAKIAEFRHYYDLSANSRKEAVLAKKISKPAPMWELKDKDGNLVKLADLKGNIVILDFWATWCSPCKQAMPILDNWMKTARPQGVKVYSVNIWERNPEQAAPFMTENEYAMTLLFGYNDLSKEYNFTGIPYLCVIDKEGNIRYEETGYSPALAENLSFWTEDLK
jgi:thiol-disulfide isomerase/thioredoxin